MKSADLVKVWSAPYNSRLTAKQHSFRLPVHVAAKLAALCDLYPNKTKTEIVGDLLSAALEEVIQNLPFVRGQKVSNHPDFGDIFEVLGVAADFQRLANKHYKELERELGTEKPEPLYSQDLVDFEHPPGE